MRESAIWIFLFGVISVFPFFPLRHIPVMDRLKTPFWKLMLYAAAIMLVQGLSYLWLSGLYTFGAPVLAWHRKLFMLPYILLTLAFTKDSKSKTLFMDFFMVGIVMAVIDFAYVLDRTWFAKAFAMAPHRTDVLVRATLTLLLYAPLYFLFKKSLRPIMAIQSLSVWRYMTAIPLIFAITSIITTMEAFGHEISPVILSIRISVIVGSVLVSALLSKVVRQMEKAVMAEEKSKQAQQLLALEETQYLALTKNIEQTRAARHDLRHQLAALSIMVEHKEYRQLQEFLKHSLKSLPTDQKIILCENHAANSVLSHYAALAKEEEISSIDIKCVLGRNSGVEDIDLCVLLGNLFENAIEGCKTLPKEQRKIKLRIATHVGALMIALDNSFDGIVQMKNGEIVSRKRGNGQDGIGLFSVEAIAHKYGGELQYEQKDGWFLVSVCLVP